MPCPSVARFALPCPSVAPTGRAVMGYRDHQLRLALVAGNYNSARRLASFDAAPKKWTLPI